MGSKHGNRTKNRARAPKHHEGFVGIRQTFQAMSAAEILSMFPYCCAALSLAAILIIRIQDYFQPTSEYSYRLLLVAIPTLLASTLVAPLCRRHKFSLKLPEIIDSTVLKACILGAEISSLVLIVPIFLLVWRTSYDDITGWTYPFLNKRWLAALYYLGIATFLVFPPALHRLLFSHSSGSADSSFDLEKSRSGRGRLKIVVGIIAAIAIALIFLGPPWHLEKLHRSVDFHEQVHLGPLQAINKGFLPFIGPASTQYGPGSQVFMYETMKLSGQFNLLGYREAVLALHLITGFVVCLVAYFHLGLLEMTVVFVLGLAFSPLGLFHFGIDGVMNGFWGWANSARYLGAIVVTPAVATLLAGGRTRRVVFSWLVLIGFAFGFFAWLSPENLSSTTISTALLLAILWSLESVSVRMVLTTVVNLAVGFTAFAGPLLLYYAFHGEAAAFLRNYFLVASAVSMGYSNMWWFEVNSPARYAYYFTPLFVIVIGALIVTDFANCKFRVRPTRDQVRLLTFILVLAACYQTALYRSDSTHLVNTMLALPFVVVLAVRDLPRWVAATRIGRAVAAILTITCVLLIYPFSGVLFHGYKNIVAPVFSRFYSEKLVANTRGAGEPFQRATPIWADEPLVAPGSVSMREFLVFASQLHGLIGPRRTFIQSVPGLYSGIVFFIADLTPAPFPFDKESMTINDNLVNETVDDMLKHHDKYDCLITGNPGERTAIAFAETHPNARIFRLFIGDRPVYVLM